MCWKFCVSCFLFIWGILFVLLLSRLDIYTNDLILWFLCKFIFMSRICLIEVLFSKILILTIVVFKLQLACLGTQLISVIFVIWLFLFMLWLFLFMLLSFSGLLLFFRYVHFYLVLHYNLLKFDISYLWFVAAQKFLNWLKEFIYH